MSMFPLQRITKAASKSVFASGKIAKNKRKA